MTPKRVAEIERWADSPLLAELKVSKAEEGWIQGGKNTAKVLITHIRDLEAQLREAREREAQLVRAVEMTGAPVPLPKAELTAWLQSPSAESLRELVRQAIADEYATATPPSPEVGA